MGHALFHPHSPGTLSASPGPISHTGTSALGEAREPQDVRAGRASTQCPADGTWTRERAGPRPWWWSWYLGRVGGLAARGAVPRCGATCVTQFSPRSSGNRRLRAAPDLLGDKLRSEVLRPAGRGLTLQNRPNPLASSLIKGHKAGGWSGRQGPLGSTDQQP